ncbi:hypothetical protein KAJ27_08985 [bacterium]|nr:hypothetical protein [bacterium]
MKPYEFLNECSKFLTNNEIDKEEKLDRGGLTMASQPRLYGEYKGHHVKVDFVVKGVLIIEVLEKPNCTFTIARHTFLSRILGKIFGGVRTGDRDFDYEYMLMNFDKDFSGLIFSKENVSRFIKFKPFEQLQFSVRDYKVKKFINNKYTPDSARNDLDRLLELNEKLINPHA